MVRLTKSLAVVLAVSATLAGSGAPDAHAIAPPIYKCRPAPDDCASWYRTNVLLSWDFDTTNYDVAGGDCSDHWFTQETRGVWGSCYIRPKGQQSPVAGQQVLIRIDKTPPSVSGAFARPPDWAGWFNHPVGFLFIGRDATSGVQSCTGGLYRGPEGPGVAVSGSCRDVAGNVGSRAISLNYDATPPPIPDVRVTPGNRKVALRWSAPGMVFAIVVRSRRGRPARTIFSGTAHRYTDRRLRNGRTYRYAVVGFDRAGNRVVARVKAEPTASKLLSPPRGARVHRPPTLRWKKARGASYYNLQLYRGTRKVLSRWPRGTRLRLHRHWTYAGTRRRLAPGRYRWYVWPGYGRRSAGRYGRLLGRSRFTVVP